MKRRLIIVLTIIVAVILIAVISIGTVLAAKQMTFKEAYRTLFSIDFDDDEAVAAVGDIKILKSRLETAKVVNKKTDDEIIETLIVNQLAIKELDIMGLKMSDDEVRAEVKRQKEIFLKVMNEYPDDPSIVYLRDYCEKLGMTIEEYFEDEMVIEAYGNFFRKNLYFNTMIRKEISDEEYIAENYSELVEAQRKILLEKYKDEIVIY